MEDRSQQVLAVGLIFIILAWITVGLRVYVRAYMLRTFALDDWLIVVTLVRLVISPFLNELTLLGTVYGLFDLSIWRRRLWHREAYGGFEA